MGGSGIQQNTYVEFIDFMKEGNKQITHPFPQSTNWYVRDVSGQPCHQMVRSDEKPRTRLERLPRSFWKEVLEQEGTTWHQTKVWSGEISKNKRKLSRSEYFTERVIKALQPPLSEDKIVTSLADHYEKIIQNARRLQRIECIIEFQLLLQREDLKDSQLRFRRIHRAPSNPQQPSRLSFGHQRSGQPAQFQFQPPPAFNNNIGTMILWEQQHRKIWGIADH